MPAAVTARTSEGPGRGRERIVPVEPVRDVPAMAAVDPAVGGPGCQAAPFRRATRYLNR